MPLVDSFNFSDHIVGLFPQSDMDHSPKATLQINSPLGVRSGDVYKVYFDRVRASNPHESVHPYFERIIKPLLEREPLELDDAADMDLDDEISEIKQYAFSCSTQPAALITVKLIGTAKML